MGSTQLKLQADIETMKTSIREVWREIDSEPDATRRAELKRSIAAHYVPELKTLLEQLDRDDA